MHYLTISFSHKNTDIPTRERLAFDDESKARMLSQLTQNWVISEAVIISTCNRVEVLLTTKDPSLASRIVFELLSKHSSLSVEELEERADLFEDEGAVHHLFAVASSLDSLVIGETQITGQIKEAFRFSKELGFCKNKISRVMQYAFRCAAEVRNQTQIAKKPVSVASVAVEKAKSIFQTLEGLTAVVVGTGEMGKLAAKYLLERGAKVLIISRTLERAKELANTLGEGARGADHGSLKEVANTYPLLFSATGSSTPVLSDESVERRNFKRVWFDLSVPRDIDISGHHGIEVITVDDLQDIVRQNISLRAEEAKVAYNIVSNYTLEFFRWINTLSVDPIIKELRKKAEDICERELKNAIKKGFIPKELEEESAKLLHAAFKKFLHEPTVNLKALANERRLDSVVESLKYLYNLSSDATESYRYELKDEDSDI